MGERIINPLFNVQDKYKEMNIINPYKFSTGGDVDLTTGLISVWELDETSGTTAYDSHGSNDGTNTNILTDQSGKINKSYYFNGSTSKTVIGDISVVDFGSGDFTFSFWINPSNISGNTRYQICTKDAAGARQFEINMNRQYSTLPRNFGAVSLIIWKTTSAYYERYTDDYSVAQGVWNHVVFIKNGSTISCYIDNTSQTLNIPSGDPGVGDMIAGTSSYLQIGSRQYSGYEEPWLGYIDQVAIWNRALSSTEVSDLYNSGNGLAYINW